MQRGGTIREIESPDRDADTELDLSQPLVLRGRASSWLQTEWSPHALAALNANTRMNVWAIDGDNPLPVGQVEVAMADYADYVVHHVADPLHDEAQKKQGPAECQRSNLHYYSGSIPLDDLSSETNALLRLDGLPHLQPGGRGHDTLANLWFGPRRGAVGLHWDGRLGYLVQLDGTKSVTVLDPEQRQWLYPEPLWNGPNSRVNPDVVDLERFPRARHAQASTTTIGPGDVLVLPAGWWHHLTATSPHATSVNVWLTLDERDPGSGAR